MGAEERVLEDRNWALFVQLLRAWRNARHPYGPRHDRLFRMHPERWLESRAMIDVLALTRGGRLAVVELKADEDIHLPLQGLDY
jgi:hypothetical protein